MSKAPFIDRVVTELFKGVSAASDLVSALDSSRSTISRLLDDLVMQGRVVRIGRRRGTLYGARREVADVGSAWPLYRVDERGAIEELGQLFALAADQYYFEATADAAERGLRYAPVVSDGLPYFLQDQRPAGFMGQMIPARYPDLDVPSRVIDWGDDHYLRYLSRYGSDTVSDLILGEQALNVYLADLRGRRAVPGALREIHYPQCVQDAMDGRSAHSSAHGEHPKFTACIETDAEVIEVLVKFSPPITTAAGHRWSDLLMAEHRAHELLNEAHIKACHSRIFTFGDRTYLESERFDRAGRTGRVGVTSLMAIDLAHYRKLDNWIACAMRLHRDRLIDAQTLEQVRFIGTFGELIANTDRHFGNLAFYDRYDRKLSLAPVYDMLPMLFAPQHDQIPERIFSAPIPTAHTLRAWEPARRLAERYWSELAEDPRISKEFRVLSAQCRMVLQNG